jgi:hypothetical protein
MNQTSTAQDRNKGRVLVDTVMAFRFHKTFPEFFNTSQLIASQEEVSSVTLLRPHCLNYEIKNIERKLSKLKYM